MRIGITGTIGSGKSAISSYLNSKGYDVFDCDEINKQLLDEKGYELLYHDFEECFFDKKLDKAKLANIVFSDENKRKKLESIMHPLILEKMLERKDNPLFCEVPLLFESNWEKYFDETLLVISSENDCINRLINRGLDSKDAKARIVSQMPVKEKVKKATRIIYNNGSLNDLYDLIDMYIKDVIC